MAALSSPHIAQIGLFLYARVRLVLLICRNARGQTIPSKLHLGRTWSVSHIPQQSEERPGGATTAPTSMATRSKRLPEVSSSNRSSLASPVSACLDIMSREEQKESPVFVFSPIYLVTTHYSTYVFFCGTLAVSRNFCCCSNLTLPQIRPEQPAGF
eukprot:3566122-Rhodomonas_salina.2